MAQENNILEQVANADLYLNNAFRILEIPVNVDEKEIRRRQKIIDFSITNNQTPPPGPFSLFAHPVNTKEALTSAIHKIHDPYKRFLDEFFWFWPSKLEDENQRILQLINENRMDVLLDLWQADENFINMHNLAVYSHLTALDLEKKLIYGGLSDIQKKRLKINWINAYKRWDGILNSNELWDWCFKRVDDYNDARLTENNVKDLMDQTLPSLVAINANLALDYLSRKDYESEAERHFEIVHSSSMSTEQKRAVISKSITPVNDRISIFIKNTDANCEKDPTHSNKYLTELIEATKPLLTITDKFLESNQEERLTIHDKIVLSVKKHLVHYVNKTDDWETARDLLNQMKNVALGEDTRQAVQKDLIELEKLGKIGNWCRKGYYDLPAPLFEEMERLRSLYRMQDYSATITGLRNLLNRGEYKEYFDFVKTALATSLVDKANATLGNTMKLFDEPRPFMLALNKMLKGPKANLISMTVFALNTGTEQQAAGRGSLYCMACGCSVTSWYVFEVDNKKYLLCSSCHQEDENEMNRRRSVLSRTLTSEYPCLNEAATIDASNPEIDVVKKIFENFAGQLNIRLPKETTSVVPSPAPPKPAPVKPAPVNTNPPSTRSEPKTPPYVPTYPSIKSNASFWRHFFTGLVDLTLANLLVSAGIWFLIENYIDFPYWANVVFIWVYFLFCHGFFSRTIGEKIFKTKLVFASSGKTPNFFVVIWRGFLISLVFLLIPLSWISIVALLLFPILNEDRRGLEDFLSGTKLVKLP